jgi:endoglucanase
VPQAWCSIFYAVACQLFCQCSERGVLWHPLETRLPSCRQWAFVKLDAIGPAVVIGEWGGKAQPGTPDLTWQRALAEYLAASDVTDTFYWCVNPNSGDTGGLLADDWNTPVDAKLEIINVACPAPSSFLGGTACTPSVEPLQLPWASVLAGAAVPTAALETTHNPVSGSATDEPQEATQEASAPAVAQKAASAEASFDPAGFTTAATVSNSWQDAGVEHWQYDVVITNTTTASVGAKLQVKLDAAEVVKIWNVDLVGDGAYQLPAWLLQSGGLQPGASFNFGCITRNAAPVFCIACSECALPS